MLQKRLQLPEILSTERAVDDSVIAGERGGHHLASHHLSIANYRPLGNGANSDDGGLRWVDHRHEPINAKHSQIGDPRRSPPQFRRRQCSTAPCGRPEARRSPSVLASKRWLPP